MKLLFIGNSFSYDANVYLFEIAKDAGVELEALNLYIGGCSLERHAKNIKENIADYQPQYNGDFYPEYHCTVEEGLRFADWDYVSIQQVSGLSGIYESYHPFVDTVVDRIKELCPKAKILMHETWAYEKGASHGDFPRYESSQERMHEALHEAYYKVAREVGCADVIPSGDVIMALRRLDPFNVAVGGESLARDGFHLSLHHGRYAAAATWFQRLGLGDIEKNSFIPSSATHRLYGDEKKLAIIKRVIKEICSR